MTYLGAKTGTQITQLSLQAALARSQPLGRPLSGLLINAGGHTDPECPDRPDTRPHSPLDLSASNINRASLVVLACRGVSIGGKLVDARQDTHFCGHLRDMMHGTSAREGIITQGDVIVTVLKPYGMGSTRIDQAQACAHDALLIRRDYGIRGEPVLRISNLGKPSKEPAFDQSLNSVEYTAELNPHRMTGYRDREHAWGAAYSWPQADRYRDYNQDSTIIVLRPKYESATSEIVVLEIPPRTPILEVLGTFGPDPATLSPLGYTANPYIGKVALQYEHSPGVQMPFPTHHWMKLNSASHTGIHVGLRDTEPPSIAIAVPAEGHSSEEDKRIRQALERACKANQLGFKGPFSERRDASNYVFFEFSGNPVQLAAVMSKISRISARTVDAPLQLSAVTLTGTLLVTGERGETT